jgi:hypothetical protein
VAYVVPSGDARGFNSRITRSGCLGNPGQYGGPAYREAVESEGARAVGGADPILEAAASAEERPIKITSLAAAVNAVVLVLLDWPSQSLNGLPGSDGLTVARANSRCRERLSRGGDRRANIAL